MSVSCWSVGELLLSKPVLITDCSDCSVGVNTLEQTGRAIPGFCLSSLVCLGEKGRGRYSVTVGSHTTLRHISVIPGNHHVVSFLMKIVCTFDVVHYGSWSGDSVVDFADVPSVDVGQDVPAGHDKQVDVWQADVSAVDVGQADVPVGKVGQTDVSVVEVLQTDGSVVEV